MLASQREQIMAIFQEATRLFNRIAAWLEQNGQQSGTGFFWGGDLKTPLAAILKTFPGFQTSLLIGTQSRIILVFDRGSSKSIQRRFWEIKPRVATVPVSGSIQLQIPSLGGLFVFRLDQTSGQLPRVSVDFDRDAGSEGDIVVVPAINYLQGDATDAQVQFFADLVNLFI